jgi:C-terminal processing protease CtpA/Prc
VSSDGELQGVGLLIANEPVNKHLLVLSAIKGGPADRAGITSGGWVEGWVSESETQLSE